MSFLTFVETPNPGKKTKVWDVNSSGDGANLGRIGFWPAWRKYVFAPKGETIFETNCLREIAQFCDDHKADRQ